MCILYDNCDTKAIEKSIQKNAEKKPDEKVRLL